MNQKNFELESKNPKYNELDRFHYCTMTPPKLYDKIIDLNTKNRRYQLRFQNLVHDIVRIRSRIFKLQKEWNRNDNPSEIGLSEESIVKFMEYTKSLEQSPEHDIFNSWSICRKNPLKRNFLDEEESIAMTDSDLEEENHGFIDF